MRVWLITGCSSGFGLSIVKQALSDGDAVVATARHVEKLKEHFPDPIERLELTQLDVKSAADASKVVAMAVDKFGAIDVLVNNAGCGLVGALEESSESEIESVFDTNFFGAVRLMQAVLPTMRRQQSGHIINISAIAGFYNEMGFSIYGASKFALEGVSESLRAELAPLGIKVTIVEPGPFRTDFIGKSVVRTAKIIDAYQRTAGKFSKLLFSIDGKQAGNPDSAAKVICRIAACDRPPLRLVLGKYAQERFRSKLKLLSEELDAWGECSIDTGFE